MFFFHRLDYFGGLYVIVQAMWEQELYQKRHCAGQTTLSLQRLPVQFSRRRRSNQRKDCGEKGTVYLALWNGKGLFSDARTHFRCPAHSCVPLDSECTGCIERDNSNTRHHLGRFTRKTKVVSKCEQMVDYSLWIWHAVTTTELVNTLQEKIISIFR